MNEKEILIEKDLPILQRNGKDFSLLDPSEKTKIRDCAKWNFFCQTCQTCNYKLICADQWGIRDWINPNKPALEIRKTGLPEIRAIDQETGKELTLEDLKRILLELAGMKIEFNVVGDS